jgi:F-type H+-transporting ATPase subunit a
MLPYSIKSDLYINSPLEQFEVVDLISLNAPIFNYFNIALTNFALYSLITLFVILALHLYANNENKLIPSKWSISLEALFSTINSMVRDQLGTRNESYLPFIYSLFSFILIANLIGLIPYNFTITSSIILSIGFSFTIFIGVTILSLYIHKLHFFSYFVPAGTPLMLVPLLILIELLSYVARAFSLGVRLFANICAGHSLLKILSTFLYQMFSSSIIIAIFTLVPFAIFTALIGLELAVCFIQSIVFSILVSSYIKDAIDLH